jgi:hypothetical protein
LNNPKSNGAGNHFLFNELVRIRKPDSDTDFGSSRGESGEFRGRSISDDAAKKGPEGLGGRLGRRPGRRAWAPGSAGAGAGAGADLQLREFLGVGLSAGEEVAQLGDPVDLVPDRERVRAKGRIV